MDFIWALIVTIPLGFIPACIAKEKGYGNFWGWWCYGWLLFLVALIHSLCLKDKKEAKTLKENIESTFNVSESAAQSNAPPPATGKSTQQKDENAIVRVLNRYL